MPHDATRVTLDNCASEPIHIPGAIQPHGALLAFEHGRLIGWSENATALMGMQPAVGHAIDELSLSDSTLATLKEVLQELAASPEIPVCYDLVADDVGYDVIAHSYDGREFLEIGRSPGAPKRVTHQARAYERLKRAQSLDQLLNVAVEEVRRLTGFDRVKAYQFRHDNSGDVVAEACAPGIESFLGLRYPASDIPAQARRLYLLNTLRMIPDIEYRPVPLLGGGTRAIDLSFSVLRSVSPIHVEYLRNMGVRASMSISIVVRQQLWGLLACHHYSPLQVPYGIRQVCDVLAQLVASGVHAIESRETARRFADGTRLLAEIAGELLVAEDSLDALARHQQELMAMFRAEGLILTQHSRLIASGGITPDQAQVIAEHFSCSTQDNHALNERGDWPEALRDRIGSWVGALGVCYDAQTKACAVALRREQITEVRWAGNPDKVYTEGPNGLRLTPRGSFSVWQQSVRGTSTPWPDVTLRLAGQLQHELRRIASARNAELEGARENLLAMLSHDLRDPLHAMTMLADVLKLRQVEPLIGQRLASTTGRMQGLVAQVLDFSRVQAGQRLATEKTSVDLTALVEDLISESRIGHPGVELRPTLQQGVYIDADRVRLSQAIGNLISNARYHGDLGQPISVDVHMTAEAAEVVISNVAAPIPAEVADELFTPYKRKRNLTRNRTGLGLGLYIASRIAQESGGHLRYSHDGRHVQFTLTLMLVDASTGHDN